jgi:methionyl-tRNA formyltransferase
MDNIIIYLNGDRGAAMVREVHRDGHGITALVFPAAKADSGLARELEALCGAELIAAKNVNQADFVERIRALSPTLGIIGGYSEIFKADLLGVPKHGTLNLHGGALPGYRGGSPLNWQIINGESEAEICVIQADAGIDTGDVLATGAIPIMDQHTIADIHEQANELFPKLVLQVIRRLEAGEHQSVAQDFHGARYWHQRNDGDGQIHWHRFTAREVFNLVRGITRPYPGAFCFADQQEVRVFATTIPEQVICGVPGRVMWLQGQGPYVLCRDRAIKLTDYSVGGDPDGRLKNGSHLT